MANIEIIIFITFLLVLTIIEKLTYEIFDLVKVGQGTEYNTGNVAGRFHM